MSLNNENPIYGDNLRRRFSSFDSMFHYSQREIELFAAAIGLHPNMVQINQKNGELVIKPNSQRPPVK